MNCNVSVKSLYTYSRSTENSALVLLRSPKQHFISNFCILTGFPITDLTVMDTSFDSLRAQKSSTKKEADPAKHGNCWCRSHGSATNVMTGLAFHATIFPPMAYLYSNDFLESVRKFACLFLSPCVEGIDIKALPQQFSILKFADNFSITIPPYRR
jgi:hypothetical protein